MSYDPNPFADSSSANPFSDPSVQQARHAPSSGAPAPTTGASDFNPFAEGNKSSGAAPSTAQPAVLKTSEEPPPPYSSTPAQRVNTDELERRQKELEERAREMDLKEEEIRRREQAGPAGNRVNNFPPLPAFCPMGPCFYQDFEIDIPVEFRRIVKMGFYLWLCHVVTLFLNIWGALAFFVVVGDSNSGGTFGVSILVFLLFTPCSFVCWYRPLYKAFRSDSSFNFFVFFFVFFCQFVVLIIQCLGLNMLGSCGFINALATTSKNAGVMIFMLVIAGMFTALAICDILLLIRVHRIYRSTGASFEKAKAEFRQGVAQNETVQDLGSSAARGAVSGAMNRH